MTHRHGNGEDEVVHVVAGGSSTCRRCGERYRQGADSNAPRPIAPNPCQAEWTREQSPGKRQTKLESGNGEPSVAVLRRLAKVLDVDLDLLVDQDRSWPAAPTISPRASTSLSLRDQA